ncbi:MAG TPA: GDSL-type esterase/lipase family protein [Methylomirabilota bacterium]
MRHLALRPLLAAAMVILQFGVFEAALRYQGGSEASPGFQQLFMPDEATGYRLRPGAATRFSTPEFTTDIVINGQGVRDDPIGPRPPDERRIVVLGDSIVMAVQVQAQETFTRKLQERLNGANADGPRYRVINAGVQGFGPVEELLFFERVAAAFDPDLVLLVVFVANDAIEAVDRAWRLDPARRAQPDLQEQAEVRLRRLVRQSMVLQILRLRVRQALERFSPRPAPDRRILGYATDPPAEIADAFHVARDVIDRLVAAARARGARAAVVLMPARFQLDPEEFGRVRSMVEPDGFTVTMDGASERFAAALSPLGVPVLDLLPVYRSDPDPLRIFFRRTVHLTPAGHAVTADALAEFLRSRDLLP